MTDALVLETIQIRIAGEAGSGIVTASELLLCFAASLGLGGHVIKNIPSTIEGGYTETITVLSTQKEELFFLRSDNILLLLNRNAIERDKTQINESELVFIEENLENFVHREDIKNSNIIKLPLRKLCYQTSGSYKYISTLIAAILGTIMDFDREMMKLNIIKKLDKKDKRILEENIKVFEMGIVWAENNLVNFEKYRLLNLVKPQKEEKIIIDGNEAIALGATKAGCKFFASYPITPATSIGECLTEILPAFNGFVYQAEDEIAAIGTVIGASVVGVKAMTATSGPGLSLMQEFLGYASMAEIPMVVVNVQRGGPSTGMPTKYAQEDLLSAIFGGQGENVRIVLSPLSIEDCFYIMLTAFYCAEYFKCPVIVLSDVSLCMTKKILEKSVFESKEEKDTSKKLVCQQTSNNNLENKNLASSDQIVRLTGIEHDNRFLPIDTPEDRILQIERRLSKLIDIEDKIKNSYELDMDPPHQEKICISIASWGGLVSIVKEAVNVLRKRGYNIAAFYPRLLYPLCKKGIENWINYSHLQIVVEANSYAQYSFLLKTVMNIEPCTIKFYGGEIPSYLEIVDKIECIVRDNNIKKLKNGQKV